MSSEEREGSRRRKKDMTVLVKQLESQRIATILHALNLQREMAKDEARIKR